MMIALLIGDSPSSLSKACIKGEGAKAIAEMLKHNRGLTSLHLPGESNIGVGGAKAIAEALKTNSSLRELYLCRELLTSSLVSLSLTNSPSMGSDNVVEDEGAIAFAESLKLNRSLQTLNLACKTRQLVCQKT